MRMREKLTVRRHFASLPKAHVWPVSIIPTLTRNLRILPRLLSLLPFNSGRIHANSAPRKSAALHRLLAGSEVSKWITPVCICRADHKYRLLQVRTSMQIASPTPVLYCECRDQHIFMHVVLQGVRNPTDRRVPDKLVG